MDSPQKQTAPPHSGALQTVDQFDKHLSVRVHSLGLQVPRWTLRLLEYSGDGLFWIPITAAVWLAPVLHELPELRSFLLNLFVAFMFDLIFIGTMKSIIRRPRPVYNKGMYVVVPVDHWSFPSGHSSRALLIAAFFWFYLPLWKSLISQRLVPLAAPMAACVLSLWAVSTACSRVLLGRHYVMDVVVGSGLGVLEAVFVHEFLHISAGASQAIYHSLLPTVWQMGRM